MFFDYKWRLSVILFILDLLRVFIKGKNKGLGGRMQVEVQQLESSEFNFHHTQNKKLEEH